MPNNTLFIYSSSAILEPFPMLRCTIRISSHNLTHHQHKFLLIQQCHIIWCRNTSDDFIILPNYTVTIVPHSPRLPISPPFRNTIPSAPSLNYRHNSYVPLHCFRQWHLHTMISFIPNLLNAALDFFFADHIVLFLCKYKDIECRGSYSNISTQLCDEDTSVNLSGVALGSHISRTGKNLIYNLAAKYFLNLAESLGRVLCNGVHNVCSIYQ